jgi:outer membrane protein
MKKICFFIFFFAFQLTLLFAQKFGYIDADYVMRKMPEYDKAQQNLEQAAQKWRDEIQKIYKKSEKLKTDFLSEELLLTDEMKKERQEEIQKIEEEARMMQNKTFGFQGQYYTRQTELLKPVLETLNKAIEKVARKNKLQVVFSNTEGLTILYAEPRHDYTEELLEELGLKEDGKEKEDRKKTKNPLNNLNKEGANDKK